MSGDYSWLSHFDLGLNWAVIIKWLPKLAQGATLTLELRSEEHTSELQSQ